MIYGNRLRYLRENSELTQEELGRTIGIGKQGYNHFETEYTIIPILHLNAFANFFNVSIDYLFEFTDKNNYSNSNKDINLEIVSQRLKEFRKENNISQVQLAEMLNVVKGTIGNYESKRSLIATPFLYTICKKYNISADYLLGKVDNPKYLK